MKYQCDIPGLEHNFIELRDDWSRGQVREFWTAKGEEYFALVAKKTTACHLDVPDGEPITSVEQFTLDAIDTIDSRVFQWFMMVPSAHINALGEMGEAARRRLLSSTGESTAPTTDSPTA